jgi:hypothetical protein
VKYWEIIADNLSKAGWSWGCVSAIDSNGQTIWIAGAASSILWSFCGSRLYGVKTKRSILFCVSGRIGIGFLTVKMVADSAGNRVDVVAEIKLVAPLHASEGLDSDDRKCTSSGVLAVLIEQAEDDCENVVAK